VPAYLASRGFDERAGRRWQVGYAPSSRSALADFLERQGFRRQEIRAAGLDGMFRDRMMFPVRSVAGAVAGFIGRAPPGGDEPVYLNSPGTERYHKGALLFGLYEARAALAAGARPVLVEGPLDAMAIWSAGVASGPADVARGFSGVAPCGTALTAAHVESLGWVASPRSAGVAVAFDADRAGRAAAVRAYPLLRAITDDVWTVSLPTGSDPADVLRAHGPAGLAAVLKSSLLPLPDLVVDHRLASFDRWLEFTDGTFAALRAVAPLIAGLPPGQVARQVARVAARLSLPHAEVTGAVTAALATG
jgi:DNA primase